MSFQTVISAAVMIYGAKNAVTGLKEGNLVKAAQGGLQAYMGYSFMPSTAAEAAAAGGTEAGASMLTAEQAAATEAANAGAGSPMLSSLDQASGEVIGGQAAPNVLETAATGTNAGSGLINVAANGAEAPAENGLLSGLSGWAKENPMLAYGAMQVGGNMMAGSAKQDWEEKMLDEQRKREDESRARRGYWAPSRAPAKSRYNPRTGQFEQV